MSRIRNYKQKSKLASIASSGLFTVITVLSLCVALLILFLTNKVLTPLTTYLDDNDPTGKSEFQNTREYYRSNF